MSEIIDENGEDSVEEESSLPFLFNTHCFAKLLNEYEYDPDTNFWDFFDENPETLPVDTKLFDPEFYIASNPDVQEHGVNPYRHFVTYGFFEGRAPTARFASPGFKRFYEGCIRASGGYDSFFSCNQLIRQHYLQYLATSKHEQSVVHKIVLVLTGKQLGTKEIIEIFSTPSLLEELQFESIFHSEYYQEQSLELLPASETYDILHWLIIGRYFSLSFIKVFDESYYLKRYENLKNYKKGLFHHYIFHGIFENRRPNHLFVPDQYIRINSPKVAALIDYYVKIKNGENPVISNKIEPSIFVHEECNALEKATEIYQSYESVLRSDTMSEQLRKLGEINPEILQDYHDRELTVPLIFHGENHLFSIVQQIRNGLTELYDLQEITTIVMIPHCRTSGAARVAGVLSRAMKEIEGHDALIFTTEMDIVEKPFWFSNVQYIFDLSKYLHSFNRQQKEKLMSILLRGINANRLINVNSRLGWQIIESYGKQFSQEMDLFSYFFCWDRDVHGLKTGYPKEFFNSTFSFVKSYFLDSFYLKRDLQEMHGLPEQFEKKLQVLYTPTKTNRTLNLHQFMVDKTSGETTKRIFWANRFDKQKRFDVLVSIASAMPEYEFHIWGKSVIGDFDIRQLEIPTNMKLHGEFKSFEELPLLQCDAWLYTSQWDGIPTLLLDVASFGIPIVSTRVEGLKDIINVDTAWPVEDIEDIEEYIVQLKNVLDGDSNDIQRKIECMYQLLESRHSIAEYTSRLKEIL